MRYEIKYSLPAGRLDEFVYEVRARSWFRRSYPTRNVHSLYFDTSDFASARDNLAGIPNRQKFRLRWYSNLDMGISEITSEPNFEIKTKEGRLGRKIAGKVPNVTGAMLKNEDARSIYSGLVEHLQANAFPTLDVPPSLLAPTLFIEYEREYYQGPDGMRMTIDKNLRFRNAVITGQNGKGVSMSSSNAVVEFKFPLEQHDQAAELLSGLLFSPVRNSKYLVGLSLLGHAVYI